MIDGELLGVQFMANRRCYLIPGFAGSELRAIRLGVNQRFWVEKDLLVLGHFDWLQLREDAKAPGKKGVLMTATVPLPDYYAATIDSLKPQLLPHDYELAVIGYDWRLGAKELGELIANIIRNDGKSSMLPCAIVAHSYGGQVARFAYESLRLTGQQSYVRRLITLGTPHQGTYAALLTASGGSETLDQIVYAQNLASIAGPIPKAGPSARFPALANPTNNRYLGNVVLTWPAIYDLMPIPGGSDSIGDPHRADIYNAGKWAPECTVSRLWLKWSDEITNPFLMDVSKLPPPDVLTTVAGVGIQTLWGLKHPERLGFPDAIAGTKDGDGTATYASALIDLSRKYSVICHHLDIPRVLAENGRLLRMILEEGVVPIPTPETQLLAGGGSRILYGPPFPTPSPRFMFTAGCVGPGCTC